MKSKSMYTDLRPWHWIIILGSGIFVSASNPVSGLGTSVIAYAGSLIQVSKRRDTEIVEYNRGVCRKTGERWELIGKSSFGARIYSSGEQTIFVYTSADSTESHGT